MDKKILYIDMDGVVADFDKAITKLAPNIPLGDGPDYEVRSAMLDEIVIKNPGFFEGLKPIEGAIEAIEELKDKYDVYFLSTPMSAVPHSYMGKKIWIKEKFGEWANKRLILTHRKDLCIGDILVDDRLKNGAGEFNGMRILFGGDLYPSWKEVLNYLNTYYEYISASRVRILRRD